MGANSVLVCEPNSIFNPTQGAETESSFKNSSSCYTPYRDDILKSTYKSLTYETFLYLVSLSLKTEAIYINIMHHTANSRSFKS